MGSENGEMGCDERRRLLAMLNFMLGESESSVTWNVLMS